MLFFFHMKKIQQTSVNGKPYQANEQKKRKLLSYGWIRTFKSPNPVKEIIINNCQDESKAVGNKFINVQFFLTQISSSEINGEPNGPRNSETKNFYENVRYYHFFPNGSVKEILLFFFLFLSFCIFCI